MEQKANITINKEHITVERTQTACGREIRVISVFPRHGSETVEDKLKARCISSAGSNMRRMILNETGLGNLS